MIRKRKQASQFGADVAIAWPNDMVCIMGVRKKPSKALLGLLEACKRLRQGNVAVYVSRLAKARN